LSIKGFISYAHDDHAAFKKLRKDIRATERALDIDFWADTRNRGGNYWSQNIADAIDAARVHLLLFTPAFIDSDYIFDHELPHIDGKCAAGDLVIPVIMQRCSWDAFVGVLQAVPTSLAGRLTPVIDWRPTRHGYDAARAQIDLAIKAHFGIAPTPPFQWGKP